MRLPSRQQKQVQVAYLNFRIVQSICQRLPFQNQKLPRSANNLEQMSKILLTKNRQFRKKQKSKKREDTQQSRQVDKRPFWKGFEQDSRKLNMERDELVSRLRQEKKKNQKKEERSLESYSARFQSSCLYTIPTRLSGISFDKNQQKSHQNISNFNSSMQLHNIQNQQNVQALTDYFQQTLTPQFLDFSSNSQHPVIAINSFYEVLLRQLLDIKSSLPQLSPLPSLKQLSLRLPSLKQLLNHKSGFSVLFNHMYDQSVYKIKEVQCMHQNARLFLQDAKQNKNQYKNKESEKMFWQKICQLLAQGPHNYQEIKTRLNSSQPQLSQYFQYALNYQHHFEKQCPVKTQLFQTNPHYRQFVLIIQKKLLQYCIQVDKNKTPQQLCYYALKQIQFNLIQRQQSSFQVSILNQQSELYLQKLKENLSMRVRFYKPQILLIKRLLALGKIKQCLKLFNKYKAITDVQLLILLALLAQTKNKNIFFVLYKHQYILDYFKTKLIQMFIQCPSARSHHYYQIMLVIAPILGKALEDPLGLYIQILSANKHFFQYCMKRQGYQNVCRHFGLTIRQLPEIIRKTMEICKNYAFCLQLALTSVIQSHHFLTFFEKSLQKNKNTLYRHRSELQNSQRLPQLLEISLALVTQRLPATIQQRIQIFKTAFQDLIKHTIIISNAQQQPSKQQIQQIQFSCELYLKLQSQELQQKLYQSNNPQNQFISRYLKALSVAHNMFRLRNNNFDINTTKNIQIINQISGNLSLNIRQSRNVIQQLLEQKTNTIIMSYMNKLTMFMVILLQNRTNLVKKYSQAQLSMCRQIAQVLSNERVYCEQEYKRLYPIVQNHMANIKYLRQ